MKKHTDRHSSHVCCTSIPEARLAKTVAEAVAFAEAIGYPVVLKAYTHNRTHNGAADGVARHLANAHGVAESFDRLHVEIERAYKAGSFRGVMVEACSSEVKHV